MVYGLSQGRAEQRCVQLSDVNDMSATYHCISEQPRKGSIVFMWVQQSLIVVQVSSYIQGNSDMWNDCFGS
jgi:hypothetical protein